MAYSDPRLPGVLLPDDWKFDNGPYVLLLPDFLGVTNYPELDGATIILATGTEMELGLAELFRSINISYEPVPIDTAEEAINEFLWESGDVLVLPALAVTPEDLPDGYSLVGYRDENDDQLTLIFDAQGNPDGFWPGDDDPDTPDDTPDDGDDAIPGLIFSLGGKFDQSWNESAYDGAEAWAAATGLDYASIEMQSEAQHGQAIRRFAEQGKDPVVMVGDIFSSYLEEVAGDFPDTTFVLISSAPVDAPNVRSVYFDYAEMAFTAGYLAAMASETGTVGFIGGMDSAAQQDYAAGFAAGAEAAVPGITVLSTMSGTTPAAWYDPVKGSELAGEMIEDGADVLFTTAGGTALGVYQRVSDEGIRSIGTDIWALSDHMIASVTPDIGEVVRQAFSGEALTPGIVELDHGDTGWNLQAGDPGLFPGDLAAAMATSLATADPDPSADGGDNLLTGTGADDTLSGLNGDDTLEGGDGDDLIRGGKDDDVLYGGAGEDILRGQSHGDVLYGGEDDDNVKGGGGNDTLYGDSGNDFLKGGSRKDVVYGGEGNDKLFGNSFDDTLDGGDGNDKLNAGGENDILIGGAGDDTLKGGAGEDVFVFDTGHGDDLVNDFDAGDDTLQLSAALADGASAADIAASATVTGNGVLIDFGDSSILLRGLTATTGLEAAIDIV